MKKVAASVASVIAMDPVVAKSGTATLVVTHVVRDGMSQAYEAWLSQVREICSRFAGHLGADVIRPTTGNGAYNIVVRFDSIEHLEAWLASPEREEVIADVGPMLAGEDSVHVQSGFDVWFTPADSAHAIPRRYKQYLYTVACVFPLTLAIPWLIGLVFAGLGLEVSYILSKLLTALVLVATLVWIVFPALTPRLMHWLIR